MKWNDTTRPLLQLTDAQFMKLFWTIFLTVMMVVILVNVAMYVLQAIGLHTIARRRGIKRPWLAWLPLGDFWILGSVSDDWQMTRTGRLQNKRILLICLYAAITFTQLVSSYFQFQDLMPLFRGDVQMTMEELEVLMMEMENTTYFQPTVQLLLMVAELIGIVLYYMCLYDLYNVCCPDKKIVFFVLSILVSVTIPFFIFFCRKGNAGKNYRQLPPTQFPWENQDSRTEL